MVSNYYTLRAVSSTLTSCFCGKPIENLFSQERDELVIRFRGVTDALVISCRKGENTCFLHPDFKRTRANSAEVMNSLSGATVDEIGIHPSDRIITFRVEGNRRLLIQLFGSKSNVLLVGQEGTVIDAFKNSRETIGTQLPPLQSGDRVYDIARLRESLAGSDVDTLHRTMRRIFPELGSTLFHEVCYRAGIIDRSPHNVLEDHLIDALTNAFAQVLQEVQFPSPRVYTTESGSPVTFSLVPLKHVHHLTEKTFPDLHEALRFFVYRKRASVTFEAEKKQLVHRLRTSIDRTSRSLQAIRTRLASAPRPDEYELYGTLLLSNLHQIKRGSQSVDLADERAIHHVQLDPSRSPSRNAQRYFEKAKRARATLKESHKRLTTLTDLLATGERLLALLTEATTKAELRRTMADHSQDYDRFGIGPARKTREEIPFRTFTVDGGFEVWAGKSSTNNDLLTLRHARPNDLWFHARGSGGSHVILRVSSAPGEPGKRAKLEAASIAAYYSRMRSAKLVPVTVTRRKYVRKPKGAPPGTVAVERESVIFAQPILPGSQQL